MKKLILFTVFIVIAALSFYAHRKELHEFPTHIHAWAQCDRYALALGFIQNGFDFFHPQTYVLNKQFPHDFHLPYENGITAVDFPIHDFIPALLMKITGDTSSFYFRIYILLYSIAGLYFLFLLGLRITGYRPYAVFIVFFVIFSPVFFYYQAGLLPTIPSLANLIIAYYYYFRYKESQKINFFIVGIFFLTLSVLSRTTYGIFMIAILIQELYSAAKNRRFSLKITGTFMLSIILIGSYLIYNHYLRIRHGSMFLSHPLLPDNLQQLPDLVSEIYQRWFYQYFSSFQYFFLLLIVVMAIVSSLWKRRFPDETDKLLIVQFVIATAGVFAFFLVMIRQFQSHDYYFLDTFLPVFILVLLLCFRFIRLNKASRFVFLGVMLIFLVGFAVKTKTVQQQRRNTGGWDRQWMTMNNFWGSEILLDSLKIPQSAKILVLDAYAPNIPFILMNRSGYAVMITSEENIRQALTWKYDYIVTQDMYYISDLFLLYPGILNQIDRIGSNKKISVYVKNNRNIN